MKKFLMGTIIFLQGCASHLNSNYEKKVEANNRGLLTSIKLPTEFPFEECQVEVSSKEEPRIILQGTIFKSNPQYLDLEEGVYNFEKVSCRGSFGKSSSTYSLDVSYLRDLKVKKGSLSLAVPVKLEIEGEHFQIGIDSDFQDEYLNKAAHYLHENEYAVSAYDSSILTKSILTRGTVVGIQVKYPVNTKVKIDEMTKSLLRCKDQEVKRKKLVAGAGHEAFPLNKKNFKNKIQNNYSDELYNCMNEVVKETSKDSTELVTVDF